MSPKNKKREEREEREVIPYENEQDLCSRAENMIHYLKKKKKEILGEFGLSREEVKDIHHYILEKFPPPPEMINLFPDFEIEKIYLLYLSIIYYFKYSSFNFHFCKSEKHSRTCSLKQIHNGAMIDRYKIDRSYLEKAIACYCNTLDAVKVSSFETPHEFAKFMEPYLITFLAWRKKGIFHLSLF